MEFQAPAFSLAHPNYCRHLEIQPVDERYVWERANMSKQELRWEAKLCFSILKKISMDLQFYKMQKLLKLYTHKLQMH